LSDIYILIKKLYISVILLEIALNWAAKWYRYWVSIRLLRFIRVIYANHQWHNMLLLSCYIYNLLIIGYLTACYFHYMVLYQTLRQSTVLVFQMTQAIELLKECNVTQCVQDSFQEHNLEIAGFRGQKQPRPHFAADCRNLVLRVDPLYADPDCNNTAARNKPTN